MRLERDLPRGPEAPRGTPGGTRARPRQPYRTSLGGRAGCKGSVRSGDGFRRGQYIAPMPTSVVTGGAGFLGSHLCEFLVAEGHRVVCVDNLETGTLENIAHLRGHGFEFVYHDVVEPIHVDGPVDFVFHLAALASPVDYLRAPLKSLKVGLLRDPQRARPREVEARALPARVDERGVRRSAGAPAGRDVLGQRQSRSARAASTTRRSATPRR